MNCHDVRDLLPELVDDRTDIRALPEARAHVAACPDCQLEMTSLRQLTHVLDEVPVATPSSRLRAQFVAMLEQEKAAGAHSPITEARLGRTIRWRWILSPLAGCALLALGFMAGARFNPNPAAPDEATKRELTEMRREFKKMTQVFGYTLLQQQQGPATERLREVLASAATDKPNDKVLDDLIAALAFDPSANIRLRALEALYPHADRDLVRAGILAALPREQNPLVQLELIDFVAAARDRAAAPVLEKISANESTDLSVRNAAQLALAQF